MLDEKQQQVLEQRNHAQFSLQPTQAAQKQTLNHRTMLTPLPTLQQNSKESTSNYRERWRTCGQDFITSTEERKELSCRWRRT